MRKLVPGPFSGSRAPVLFPPCFLLSFFWCGRLTGMFKLNIVVGTLIPFVANGLLAGVGPNAWRWMLGVAAFPSLLYAVFCFGLPESPRWLLSRKNDRQAAMHVLQRIEPECS